MPVPGATGYRVYRRSGGKWGLVTEVPAPPAILPLRAGTTQYMVSTMSAAGEAPQLQFGVWTTR